MRKGDKKKGMTISHETLKAAILACSGNVMQMVQYLGLNTEGSVYYLLNKKFPDLGKLRLNLQAGDSSGFEENLQPDTDVYDLSSDTTPVLTQKQVDILDFIDTNTKDNPELGANVSGFSIIPLSNLELRGFIVVWKTREGTWAKLTEAGDVGRIKHTIYGSREWFAQTARVEVSKKPVPKRNQAKINHAEFMRPEKGVVASEPKAPSHSNGHECDNCVHQETLEFLVNNRPELSELVEATLKMKAAQRDVRAEIDKLGWSR